MPKYIAIFGTEKPFTPEEYPTLFAYLEQFPRGAHIRIGVMAFEFDGTCDDLCRALYEHLEDGDELSIFQLSAGVWRLDGWKDEQMRQFFCPGT